MGGEVVDPNGAGEKGVDVVAAKGFDVGAGADENGLDVGAGPVASEFGVVVVNGLDDGVVENGLGD